MASCALAQIPDTGAAAPAAPGPNPLVTLASQFFEHNYANFYAYGDGVLDTNTPTLNSRGQATNSLGTGYDVGGGANLFHAFHDAQLTFGYNGSYRSYQNGNYNNGTSQTLNLSYTKRLNRHFNMNIGLSAGQYLYGGTVFTNTATTDTPLVANPFSPETRWVSGVLGFTYMQTRRLSYSVYGSTFLYRYDYPGAVGTTGATGGGSVNYRLTARTSVSAVYSHSYFAYQGNAGDGSADQFGASITHQFNAHWSVSAFGGAGVNRVSGTVLVPVTLLVGNNTAVGGYAVGRYNQTYTFPSYNGSVSRSFRRSVLVLSAGEGLAAAGNGYFLSSKNVYFNGLYSFSVNRQNISVAAYYTHLTSIANTVTNGYDSFALSAQYSHMLLRYLGAFVRYDYVHYGGLAPFNGTSDNRFAFGLSFSSRSIPLTLF
jgi:hypothetical protein